MRTGGKGVQRAVCTTTSAVMGSAVTTLGAAFFLLFACAYATIAVVGRLFEQRSGVLVNWSYEGELDWESPCELMNEYMTVEAAKRRALTMNGCAGFCFQSPYPLPHVPVVCSFVGCKNGLAGDYLKVGEMQTWSGALRVVREKLGHNLRLPAAREDHCALHHCGCCPVGHVSHISLEDPRSGE